MPTKEALDTEYESGVADVLAFLAGDTATVERNVRLQGRRSGVPRQIDVLVRDHVAGLLGAVMVVDCKRWNKPVDVADVGSFLDLLEDVGADVGLLVSVKGASRAAIERARQARGVRLDVLNLDELERWSPPGTVTTTYRIPAAKQGAAAHALRRAGLRVRTHSWHPECGSHQVDIEVFRHYGSRSPSADVQRQQWEVATTALAKAGVVDPIHVGHGIVDMGGSPGFEWLEVAFDGRPVGFKVGAVTEDEAEEQLRRVREQFQAMHGPGFPADRLSVLKRDGWPREGLFPQAWQSAS